MEHRIIQGGEQYLPFARSCVAKLKKLGLSYASQTYQVDGATIRVRITPGHEYIHIEGGEYPLYQFLTTGPNPLERESQLPIAAYTVKVGLDKKTKTLTAEATGSTAEASSDDPPKWPFSWGRADASRFLQFKNTFQVDGITQHQFYPNAKGPRFVGNSWTSASQTFDLTGRGIHNPSLYASDVLYDMSPSIFTKARFPRGQIGVAPDADWYRRGACQTVQSEEFGSRFLVMLTDTSGDLYVYPIDEYDVSLMDSSPYSSQEIGTNIPAHVVNKQKLPLPDWARPYGDVPARETPNEIPPNTGVVWKFSSDGTRMMAILPSDLPWATFNEVEYNPLLAGQTVRTPMNPARRATPECAPGMIELRINITLTGPLPEEFDVTLELINEVPPSGDRCIIAADYYWGDIKDAHAPTGLEKDEIVVIDFEMAHKRNPPVDGVEPIHSAIRSIATVRSFTSGRTLRSFVAYQADAPYCMNGATFEASVLKEMHRLFTAIMGNLESRINNWLNVFGGDIRMDIRDYKDAAIAEATSFKDGITVVTPEVIAQYDSIADRHIKAMFAFADGIDAALAASSRQAALGGWVDKATLTMSTPNDAPQIVTSMLAYDLRALAFAVQAATFKHDENTVTRQDRIQVIVRNEVVHTVPPPDPEFQALAASFDGPQDTSGWTKFDQSAKLNPSRSMFAYRQFHIKHDDEPGQQLRGRQDFDSDYPVGAAAHSRALLMFMCCDALETFCVHPAGHWSICTNPLVYYAGESTQLLYGYTPLIDVTSIPMDPTKFVQNIIDLISVQIVEKGETTAIRGSHIDLFNQAYSKSIRAEDFHLTITAGEIERAVTLFARGVTMTAAGDPPAVLEFLHTTHERTTLFGGLSLVGFSNPISYLDARSFLLGDLSYPVRSVGGRLLLRVDRFEGKSPVIRGSALFGGTTIRLP